MLNLYLLRHGKAVGYTKNVEDYSRDLDATGRLQIQSVAEKMQQKHIQIGQVISSKANRAAQTCQIVCAKLNLENISYHEDLFLASTNKILYALSELAKNDNLLYVGHNFGISEIVGYLTDEQMSLSTGMLVHIEFDCDHWDKISKHTGRVISTLIP